MKIAHVLILVSIPIFLVASHVSAKDDHYARGIVILALELPNNLKVGGAEFRTKDNPKGEGVFVYDPRTTFNGVQRYLIWIVLDDEAYPLNGPSKMLTPGLKWPRDVAGKTWEKTGLSPYSATEATSIIFGD